MKMLLRYYIEASAAPEMIVATSYEDFCSQVRNIHGLEADAVLKITHKSAVLKHTAVLEMILEHYPDPEFNVSVIRDSETDCDSGFKAIQPVARVCDFQCKKPELGENTEPVSKGQFIEHAKQKVLDVLRTSENDRGRTILERINQDAYLPTVDYKKCMEIFVLAIKAAPRLGKALNELKFEYAVGFVNLFPIYKDPQTTWGCEAVFRKSSKPGGEPSGSLHNKFKNSGRVEKRMKRFNTTPAPLPKVPKTEPNELKLPSPCLKRSLSFNDENVEREATDDDDTDQSQMEVQGHIHWLLVNACEAKRAEVLARLVKTFNNRSDSLHESALEVTAYDILERYPCFLSMEGLVDHDFKLMLPEFENVLVEKWPGLKLKVRNWVDKVLKAEAGKTGMTDQLQECLASNPANVPYLDDVMVLKILLAKLPSCNQAQRRGVKVAAKNGLSYLVDFQSNGTNVEQLLADRAQQYSEPVAPYILMIRSGRCIDSAFVVVDHRAVPASVNIVKAFDTMFKSHYVFCLEYQPQICNLMNFFQTAIYGIDTAKTGENTTVRSARIAFG